MRPDTRILYSLCDRIAVRRADRAKRTGNQPTRSAGISRAERLGWLATPPLRLGFAVDRALLAHLTFDLVGIPLGRRAYSRRPRPPACPPLRATITLKVETRTNLKAENAVGIIPGSVSDEFIILNAHYDGWFEGAGDNGDGLSVLMALARHFAKPEHRPRRTLALVSSAGHHSPGINGPRGFVAANPALAAKAVLMLNIEHVAQRNFAPSRMVAPDGYREAIADSGEAPITAGITNRSPFLDKLFDEGVLRYGVNFVSDRSAMQSGETGGYLAIKAARLTVMQAPPLYHTTGEVREVISTPGLERIARFFAYFVKEVDMAQTSHINP
jgi:hypothetical protein